jgi:hypothetical protein
MSVRRVLPGITSPLRNVNGGELDWVIVRENSEAATDVAMFTRAGVERIMRFAFRLAQSRPRKLLTVVTKSNAQRHAMVMWDEIAAQIAGEFKDVTWDKMLVDAMTMRMVMRPETIDTVVATNLHADILSDLAAALAGSLGMSFRLYGFIEARGIIRPCALDTIFCAITITSPSRSDSCDAPRAVTISVEMSSPLRAECPKAPLKMPLMVR